MNNENVPLTSNQSFLYQKSLWKLMFNLPGVLISLVLVAAGVGAGLFVAPQGNFLAGPNFKNMTTLWSLHAMLVPATLLILAAGGLDLSIAAVLAASATVAASLIPLLGVPAAAAASLILALVIGLINGLLTGATRLNGAVITLGTAVLIRGLLTLFSQAKPVVIFDAGFLSNPSFQWTGVVIALVLGIPLIIVCQFRKSAHHPDTTERWGTRLFYTASPYILSSLLAGLAGLIYLGQLKVAIPTTGAGFEVDALLIAIIGGTPIANLRINMGPINLIGALIATAALVLIQDVILLANGPAGFLDAGKGALVVFGGAISYLYYYLVMRIKPKKSNIARADFIRPVNCLESYAPSLPD